MRKHVTPAEPTACIPDPSRGRDLPATGAEVDWTPYWAGMEARSEVTVQDVAVEPAPATVEAEPVAAPAPDAEPAPVAEPEAETPRDEVGPAPEQDPPEHETHAG